MPELPPAQQALQKDVEDTWKALDKLDADAERRIRRIVEQVRKDVLDRLAEVPTYDADGQQSFQSTYLRQLEQDLRRLVEQAVQQLQTSTQSTVEQAASVQTPLPGGITASPIGVAREVVQAASLYQAQVFRGWGEQVTSTILQNVQHTVFGGQSRWDTVRAIRAAMSTASGKAEGTLVASAIRAERTAIMSVYNAASNKVYRSLRDTLPEMMTEWVTGSSRVCPRCQALSGKRVRPGRAFPDGSLGPPKHFSCRCRLLAWMPGWAKWDPDEVGAE